MAKPLSWIFELVDKMSGPGQRAAKGVAEVEKALVKATEAEKKFVKTSGEAQRATKSFGSGLGGLGLQAFGWIETIKQVGGVAFEVGKFAVHAQAFKEDTLLGLEVILQSKEKANQVLASAMKFAAATPFTTTQVMGWTKDLLVGGFNPKEAELLMTVAGDFGALKGDDEYVQRVIFQLTKLNAVGKLTGETMMQLGEAGLPVQKVYEALAKQFHTTVAGVQQLQAAGRIDSGSGINAIVQAIAGLQGGKVGTVLSKRSQTLSGLWSTLTSRPEELAMGVGGGGMDRMKGAMETLAAAFDPASPGGQRLTASLTRLSDTVTRLFIEPLSGPDGAARVEKAISGVITVFEGLAYIFAGIGDLVGWLWNDGFLPLGDHIAQVAFGIWYAWDWVTTKLSRAWEGLKDIGVNLMKGLAWGIEHGVEWVIEAIGNLAITVVDTLKAKLGIHSPSTVFEGLGLNVAAGFEQGVDGGAGGASSAVEAMVRVPRAGGAGGGLSLAPGAVVVNVHGGGDDIEERVREAVLQALASAFEQLGLEAGGDLMAGYWDTLGGELFGDGIVSIWDRFVVAGRALPGAASVEGHLVTRLDERNAAGNDGATLTHMGNDGAQVVVRLRMWTIEQHEAWQLRAKELRASTGKARPKPVMVYHPALATYGIKSLYVKEVGLLRVQNTLGEVSIKFIEFLPVSKAGIVTPKAAINTAVPSAFGPPAPAAGAPPSKKGAGP